jgi:hypothetical protein
VWISRLVRMGTFSHMCADSFAVQNNE